LHPSGVAKLSTSFGWGKGGNVTSAGWQVTLCDPIWYVSSRSGDGCLQAAIRLLHFTFTFYSLLDRANNRQRLMRIVIISEIAEFAGLENAGLDLTDKVAAVE